MRLIASTPCANWKIPMYPIFAANAARVSPTIDRSAGARDLHLKKRH